MSSFRETAAPVVCAACGGRVLVPHVRPGTRLKCPKCGSVLRLPAATDAGHAKSAIGEPAADPTAQIGAEIDELLLGDIAATPPGHQPPPLPPKQTPESTGLPVPPASPPELPKPNPPPKTESSPHEPNGGEAPLPSWQPGVAPFDAPADTDFDDYKLSDSLGPLPVPMSREPVVDRAHPAQSQHGQSGAADSRLRHMLDVVTADKAAKDRGDGEPAEKFTPHATLSDPRQAFLRGVFDFLFYRDVMPQWLKLAFTLTLNMALVWYIFVLVESAGSDLRSAGFQAGGIAIGALLLIAPAVLFAFIWIAMTWAVGSAILEDTAAGMNHIENWPESLVLDDLPTLVCPGVATFLAAVPALAIHYLSKNGAPQIRFLEPVFVVLLFPFLLLSILETGSVFVPISKPVYRCVRKRPGTWVWFYVESTAILGAAAWITTELWLRGAWWRFALAATLATAAIIVYFRLLGRLGLVCANQALEWTADEDAAADEERASAAGDEEQPVAAGGHKVVETGDAQNRQR